MIEYITAHTEYVDVRRQGQLVHATHRFCRLTVPTQVRDRWNTAVTLVNINWDISGTCQYFVDDRGHYHGWNQVTADKTDCVQAIEVWNLNNLKTHPELKTRTTLPGCPDWACREVVE